MMETTGFSFHTSFYITEIHNMVFTFHMYAYLLQIPVVIFVELRLKTAYNFKMWYVIVIMLSGQLLFLLINNNKNTTVEMDPCLLRVLHCNILVHYHRHKLTHPKNHVNGMQYFTLFCLMIANKMLLQLPHTVNILLNC